MKKLNLTVTVEAIGTVTIEVPDDMSFDEAMTWAKFHKGHIPTPTNLSIIDNIIDIDEDNSDFDEGDEVATDKKLDSPIMKQFAYQYVELNHQTLGEHTHKISISDGGEFNYPTYLCVDGDINQFKADVTKAGLWTMDIHMNNGKIVVVAVDLPKVPNGNISIDQKAIELACLNTNLSVHSEPFPETRMFEFPVSYAMYGSQPIRAANMVDALKQLEKAPLPSDSHYVDESFVIDDDGIITTHN